MPEKKRGVFIIDDVEPMRKLLELTVAQMSGFALRGSAANSTEARIQLSRHRADLVLLDEVLPGESSIDLLEDLLKQGIKVVLLTSVEDPTHPIPPGALGRIQKPALETIEEDQIRIERQLLGLISS